MSTTTKNASTKGVRYTDAQKKEVVDFALSYNNSNGRGGQSKAAEKFNISPLTIAAWLKTSGKPAKAAKAVKAPKAAPKAKAAKAAKGGKTKLGSRYTDEQKKEVIDFVVAYNAANGRGGSSKASKKFSISPLTVVAWLKASGVSVPKNSAKKGIKYVAPGKAAKAGKISLSGGLNAKLTSLLALSNQISKAEAELVQLKSKFNSLKASL
ncbi:MAG: hypothetical protein V4584_10705 [Verrucomicrobiota bacterium]